MRVAFYDGSMILVCSGLVSHDNGYGWFGFGTAGLVLACVCGHR